MIKLIPGADYYVRFVPLPAHVGGVTVANDDGTFDIYINENKPLRIQWESYQHEIAHIQLDHFYRDDISAEQKEIEADEFAGNDEMKQWLRKCACL